jgi:transposase
MGRHQAVPAEQAAWRGRVLNDRRVLNGIFWVLRSGAPWRDLPVSFGPRTTCYNRFVRWRRAGVWDRIMNALSADHDAAVQMTRPLQRPAAGNAGGSVSHVDAALKDALNRRRSQK